MPLGHSAIGKLDVRGLAANSRGQAGACSARDCRVCIVFIDAGTSVQYLVVLGQLFQEHGPLPVQVGLDSFDFACEEYDT